MRIRHALVGATAAIVIGTGLAAAPAQAAAGAAPATDSWTGDYRAAASWHTIDEYFWGWECEAAAIRLERDKGWIVRCYGGSLVSYYELQRWY
ncbi:hypothetical protein [Streptomyces sp. RFCAC02]|uniref:hypothetical protein n=1 Tax=Streptomyces sp. RFCAC02 TaxID=2499143 RepID=UPI00101F3D37|nr:hypothetical protein [Streptomyces sp. RFCAC02]